MVEVTTNNFWFLAVALIFLPLTESRVTCQIEPEDPKIVLLDVDSDTVSLKWEDCNVDAGETLTSVFFSRQKIGSVSPETIALRSANAGFTMRDPFKDFKKYRALLDQELRIYDVQRNEKYVYTLTMNYDNSGVPESTIFQVTVVVKVPPKITTSPTREIQLNLGQNYTLNCNASGDPHPNITWTKDGVPASQFNASGYLHLVDVQREDAGSYTCTASNGFGDNVIVIGIVNIRCSDCKTERVGITLHEITYKPPLSNQVSVEFKNLESKLLSAIWGVYTENPEKQLYSADVEEFRSGSVYAVVELAFGSTVIDPLKALRDGMNDGKLGSFTVDRQLDVNPIYIVPPKITTAPTRKVQLRLSSSSVQNHTLKCNASGYPNPNITWTKDGVPASQFNASGYLLHLVDVQREDAGSYICTAGNGYGDDATAIGIVNIICSDCRTERVGITIQGMDYKPPLSNQSSIEYKNLESKLLSAIWRAYTDNPEKQLHRVDVKDFRSGSVYAVVELAFASTVIDPLKPLRDEMNDGKLGSFTVDRQLDVNPTIELTTLSPSKTSKCANWRKEIFFTPVIQLSFFSLWWLSLSW